LDSLHYTPNAHTYTIELDPEDYEHKTKPLFEIRDKWFVNISNAHIPDRVIGFLQLGEGFCLPSNDKNNLVTEYIKHIENNLTKFQQQNFASVFRSQLCSFVNEIKYLDNQRTDLDREILDALFAAKIFTKRNPEIIFTRSDKGNTVVALDRTDYINKMEAMLRTPILIVL